MKKLVAVPALVLTVVLAACSDQPTAPADFELAVQAESPASKPVYSDAAKPGASTIAELAGATDALSTLFAVILYSDATCDTDFASLLGSTDGQYTAFAPTNDAFSTLIGALGESTVLSCNVLPTVLAFHVTKGRHHSRSVLAHKRFRMLSGEYAAVDAAALTIGGAALNAGLLDISASNGIVHVVNDVLIPGSILAALAG